MKTRLLTVLSLLVLSVAVRAESTDDIIALQQKNVGEEVLLATVDHSNSTFNLGATDIIKLRQNKVPDKVIAAMIRHKAPGDAAPLQANANPPAPVVAPAPAPVAQNQAAAPANGTLNIENLDDKTWSYRYEPDIHTLWISSASADGKGNIAPNGGVSLRMPAGTYNIRYNGQANGQTVTVFGGDKSLVMLSRVSTADKESLYVSLFERGERRPGGQLVVLHDNTPQSATRHAEQPVERPVERVVERERYVEEPSTVIIYRDAYYPPVYSVPLYPTYYPRYYCPPSSGVGFGYSHFSHHSGVRVGVGIGF